MMRKSVFVIFIVLLVLAAPVWAVDYIVNSAATDHGATTAARSAKSLIDAIGTSKSANLIFKHSSAGNTTTYTFGTDETIPSNINVVIEKGAILAVATTKTLTISGHVDAGIYQIFSLTGTGAIAGLEAAYPEWWGIDGTADEVQINAALSSSKKVILADETDYSTAAPIKMQARTALIGGNDSWIIPVADHNGIELAAGTVALARIENVKVDGVNQTTASYGIYLSNTGYSASGGDLPTDPSHRITGCFMYRTGNGIMLVNGARGCFVSRNKTWRTAGIGIYAGNADCHFSDNDVGVTGYPGGSATAYGFYVANGSNTLTGNKVWYCGSGSAAPSYLITSDSNVLVGNIAQDGYGAALDVRADNNVISGFVADDNEGIAVRLYGADNNVITAQAHNSAAPEHGSGHTYWLTMASNGADACEHNTVTIRSSGTAATAKTSFGGSFLGNVINLDNNTGFYTGTFAADYMPDVYLGAYQEIALTGNITIKNITNAATTINKGQHLGLILTQDGHGSRTVTWESNYNTNWAPDLTADRTSSVTLIYNGTRWDQIASGKEVN